MNDAVDTVVVGAGVVGLAIGRALAERGREVVVLEALARPGELGSTHNSGVIHAGIHYPPGSLKARLCLRGRELLYRYCAARAVPHRRCGKLTLAHGPAQETALARLADNARACGVALDVCDAADIARLAPGVRGSAGLWSAHSGIVDAAALVAALAGDLQQSGGLLLTGNRVDAVHVRADGFQLHIDGAGNARCRRLVNAAGLHATALATRIDGLAPATIPALHLARGNWFRLHAPSPWTCLVYPLPEPGGLGLHSTPDLDGRTRFGPDVEWIDSPDFAVNAARLPQAIAAIRRWWPALPAARLQPEMAGVRPKLRREGASDFLLQGPAAHGLAGLWNLYGIESPGLTAALAIGEMLAAEIAARE